MISTAATHSAPRTTVGAERLRVELAVLDALEQGRRSPAGTRGNGAGERGKNRLALLLRRLGLDPRGHSRSLTGHPL